MRRAMKRRTQIAIYTGASALWAMAVLGAIGVAYWLGLSSRDTILLVIAVAVVAIFGTFMPAVQLGITRWREAHPEGARNREQDRSGSPKQ
jgi:hypothetical protein